MKREWNFAFKLGAAVFLLYLAILYWPQAGHFVAGSRASRHLGLGRRHRRRYHEHPGRQAADFRTCVFLQNSADTEK